MTQSNNETDIPELDLKGSKSMVSAAILRVLKPLARLCIRSGITHREFSDISKAAFVGVARNDYGLRGRQANKSRVAILTGLGRKQVNQIIDAMNAESETPPKRMSPATRVISAWHQDPDFLGDDGEPRLLPLDGPHPSFDSIAKKYAGDLPVSALLRELKRVSAVVEDNNSHLQIVTRVFLTESFDPDHIRILATQLHDLGTTVLHNLEPPEGASKRLQRFVVNENMSKETAEEFQNITKEHAQVLLEKLDSWLTKREISSETASNKSTQRIGLGVYSFQEDAE